MIKLTSALALLALFSTPAYAALDRAAAVAALAGVYNSVDACKLLLSRAKVVAYADSLRPAGDTLFNVDVFRATKALADAQKTWTQDQTDTYCKQAVDTAKRLELIL